MAKKVLTNYDFVQNEIQNARVHNLAAAPSSPAMGQIYYDTVTATEYFWNGTWVPTDAQKRTGIPLANLATNPLARANHTGTQLAGTISDFDTAVRLSTLNQMAVPTAAVAFNNQKITGLGNPTLAQDAATMAYVDSAVMNAASGIDSKASVRMVATTNIAALSGLSPIDGITPVASNRLLLVGQTTASQNGVYIAAAGAWSRATDADLTGEITPGSFWFVEEGTTYGKTQWRCSNTGAITVGVTAITITQFGATADVVAGAGVSYTGNTLNVGQGTGIVVGVDTVAIDTAVVVRKVGATIGDGVSTAITVTHSLGNQDVITQVREVATNNVVECDIQNNGINTVVLSFAVAPATNSLRVAIQG